MKRIKENPISSILGVIVMFFALLLFFIETKIEVTVTHTIIIFCIGAGLLFAKDRLITALIEKVK